MSLRVICSSHLLPLHALHAIIRSKTLLATCGMARTRVLHQVREACSILDIDILFYPCPKGGPNFRPKVNFVVMWFI